MPDILLMHRIQRCLLQRKPPLDKPRLVAAPGRICSFVAHQVSSSRIFLIACFDENVAGVKLGIVPRAPAAQSGGNTPFSREHLIKCSRSLLIPIAGIRFHTANPGEPVARIRVSIGNANLYASAGRFGRKGHSWR